MSEAVTSRQDWSGGPRVAVLALGLALLALGGVLLIAGPALFRLGLVDLAGARSGVQQGAMWAMLGAVGAGLIGLLLALIGKKHRAGIVAVAIMIPAGMGAGSLYNSNVSQSALPPINDAQTDWTRPVAFTEATLRERAKVGAIRVRDDAIVPEGNGKWSGKLYSQAQAEFYIDLAPLIVKQPVAAATAQAAKSAERLGWQVTVNDPRGGVVEAVYHSPWFDLAYDIAIRVAREGEGSRIDVRSTSRLPGHDMGENATQVKQIIDEMALQLR
ncbi:MAG: hypothetical protein B7Y90_12600 [Alphaproteobacteria bacterium 32-64-14]|nr:MAG: hypothetical protein B7Y90_12600 [Alphaproteobacteria bacterium 32-64-14]